MPIEMKPIDLHNYNSRIKDFLPSRLIDVHTHIWLKKFSTPVEVSDQAGAWADRVAAENTVEEITRDYQQLLPQQQVTPVLFGYPARNIDPVVNNRWVHQAAQKSGYPALLVSTPDMAPLELEAEVNGGGFRGLKPYPDFAPLELKANEVSIFDFLPWSHLEMADANRWVVMLHIPRSGRLNDPTNLEQLLQIEKTFKNLRLIIAHMGRAYCPEDFGGAMEVIQQTQRLFFDFSANTCPEVMQKIIQTVGSQRVLFGSDMPITKMRMQRVCESGQYINLIPEGAYGDVRGDPHMREVSKDEGEHLTFFLYEEILAFRNAAERLNLSSTDVEDIFFNNAHRLFFESV